MTWLIPLFLVLHLLVADWLGGWHVVCSPGAAAERDGAGTAGAAGVVESCVLAFLSPGLDCVVTLLVTGHGLTGFGAGRGSHSVMLMMAIGWVMAVLFAVLYFKFYAALRAGLAAADIPAAAAAQNVIRQIVVINLILGLITCTLGVLARFFG